MESKQTANLGRIIFLRKFTETIIYFLTKEEIRKRDINVEKIKQKLTAPATPPRNQYYPQQEQVHNPDLKESLTSKQEYIPKEKKHLFRPSIYSNKNSQGIREISKPNLRLQPQRKFILPFARTAQKKAVPIHQNMPVVRGPYVQPTPQQRPEGLYLGRLEPLLRDSSIQQLECPGPGKNILVKRYGKTNLTRLALPKIEIDDIIISFSNEANIPIAGGILKAAVGDLVISAVVSEYAGARFVINKITPYNMVEGNL